VQRVLRAVQIKELKDLLLLAQKIEITGEMIRKMTVKVLKELSDQESVSLGEMIEGVIELKKDLIAGNQFRMRSLERTQLLRHYAQRFQQRSW
jgi:hypothetical protein